MMTKEKKENMKIESIEIVPIQPEAADTRKIEHYNKTLKKSLREETFLVKIKMPTRPFFRSMGYELFIGDRQIRKYMAFKNGIFFKVNDPGVLEEISGKKIRFRLSGAEEFIDSGTVFAESAGLMSAKKAFAEKKRLPTLQEALEK
jgi:hypothetical protein